jgi:SAM-dependent methyltransferase
VAGPFDPARYWRDRLADHPGLTGTGTSMMPEAWQRWLYRSKERAYRELLAESGVAVRGRAVLDFGCGTGYFEDVWERAGAAAVAGVDIVPETIARLSQRHPARRYVCADLARDASPLDALGRFDVVTAIDVLYHVVDDAAAERVIAALLGALAPGGAFLFTDALVDERPDTHVAFRSLAWWTDCLARHGARVVARQPVAVLHNRPSVFARKWPQLTGAAQYYADAVLRRIAARRANNWAVIARR